MSATTTYVSLKDTNAAIRKALKAAFPGVKFSVVGDKYAGGASTRVAWTDGPALADVETVVQAFAGATFDGMTDIKDYRTSTHDGEVVHWGADFVFAERSISPEAQAELAAEIAQMVGVDADDFDLDTDREVPSALYEMGMTRTYGTESGHRMVRWLAEHRAATPKPNRSSGVWTDEETARLARRAA